MNVRTSDLLSRRNLIKSLGVAGVASALGAGLGQAAAPAAPKRVVLGVGKHRYEWVSGWGKLPAGMSYGNTHGGIVVDARGRVYVNTDSEHAIVVFEPSGSFVKAWGKDFAGGLHGMCLVQEDGREVLYLAHTSRHEVVKASLDGEVLHTLPFPEKAGIYKDKSLYKPTGVAVAPTGEIFVGDGYGLSWVHKYTAKGEYVKSFGGKGAEPGKMNTPHGVWIDTRRKTPSLIVADRANARLQVFDLDGKLLDVVAGILNLPCGLHQRGTDLVVPDLSGRVTILDKDNRLVAHLGENLDPERKGKNKVAPDTWTDGEFIAPHSARWDARGDLYVMDWNYVGRITKLRRLG